MVLLATLVIVARQIVLQRRDLEFRIYQRINDRYSDLLWRAAEDPTLDAVWQELTPEERAWLRRHSGPGGGDGPNTRSWRAWTALSNSSEEEAEPPPFDPAAERKIYRFTRAVLEVIEQAHFARTKKSIQPETWDKFESVLDTWIESRYFDEVFEECAPRFTKEFQEVVRGRAAAIRPD